MRQELSRPSPSLDPEAGDRTSPRRGRLPRAIEPMLAAMGADPFDSPSHLFEVKWDGVRALLFLSGAETRIQDRYLRDVSARYPELKGLAQETRAGSAVLDGEIVVLDGEGRPDVSRLRRRLSAGGEEEAGRLAREAPVTFQAFDILYCGGRSVMGHPLWWRKRLLQRSLGSAAALEVPGSLEGEGVALFEAAREHGLEGIVAKERDSPYLPGQRSPAWLKLKVHQKEEFVIGGFTYGGRWRGERPARHRQPFESLLLGLYDERGELRYVGEVAGGFAGTGAEEVLRALEALAGERCPFREEPDSQKLLFWCRPELAATVRFAEWTPRGRLRFPVYEGLRPDVPPASCRLDAVRAP